MSGATGNRIDEARARLAHRRAELERLIAIDSPARRPVELDQGRQGRLSRMDAMRVQAMSMETARRRTAGLGRIAAALARIEAGDYGACVSCGEEIAARRLEHDPATALCIDCARAGERAG